MVPTGQTGPAHSSLSRFTQAAPSFLHPTASANWNLREHCMMEKRLPDCPRPPAISSSILLRTDNLHPQLYAGAPRRRLDFNLQLPYYALATFIKPLRRVRPFLFAFLFCLFGWVCCCCWFLAFVIYLFILFVILERESHATQAGLEFTM